MFQALHKKQKLCLTNLSKEYNKPQVNHHTSFIMPFATITSKGQTNIPKSIRQQLALDSGDRILFAVDENGAVSFEPATKDIIELRGIVLKSEKPVSVEDMKSAVKSAALDRAGHP
ncbi:MAG: type II toxin-antitoxin system PrlF family antitoxin [Gammaproteobacteria bacterium]|nr:type II toxin-antitoxin system PrlF family antitoxin [Gammaproteobacteria bacterium]